MRVLCIGDSLTAGFVDGGAQFFPYAKTLQKLLDNECGKGKHQVEEASSCGEDARSMASRNVVGTAMEKRKRLPPKIVVLLAGTNDLRAWPQPTTDDVVDALASLAAAAKASGAKTLILTVPRMPAAEARTPSLTARRHDLNARVRAEETFHCADVAAGFEECGDDLYDADGLHLSKAGYRDLAKLVYPALRGVMKRKKAPPAD